MRLFLLGHRCFLSTTSSKIVRNLTSFLKAVANQLVNEVNGHNWRSKTLRSLRISEGQPGADSFIDSSLKNTSREIAATILNGTARALLRPLANESAHLSSTNELEKIIYDVCELAFTLWTQKNFITCHALDEIQVFKAKSAAVTAHRLHHLDEDDETLDGQVVVLVTHPVIVAHGDEHAENYHHSKLWTKAIACVHDTVEQKRLAESTTEN